MTEKKDYIQWICSKVGHELIILNFAGGIVCNEFSFNAVFWKASWQQTVRRHWS